MGMTLLVHTLQDRVFSSESDDHSFMNDHAEALDAICQQLGVPLLSSFFDFTDLTYNLDDDDDDDIDEPEDEALDPDTGWGYGIDAMTWFEASQGLLTLKALLNYLATNPIPGVDGEESQEVADEIADCIKLIEPSAAVGGQFHLAVIM